MTMDDWLIPSAVPSPLRTSRAVATVFVLARQLCAESAPELGSKGDP
jgi:hypothetical protein